MKCLDWLVSRALILVFLFGFFAWGHPLTQLRGNDIKAYVAGPNNVGVRACRGLRAGMSAHVLSRADTMARVRFGNDAQPPECRNRWAWVPYEFLPREAWSASYAAAQRTEAGTCANCEEVQRPPANTGDLAAITGQLNSTYTPLPGRAARDCRAFVTPEGQLGDYGRRVLAAIRQTDPQNRCFLGGGVPWSQHVCPGYRNFSPQTRERFWVYAFAAIAHDESTCNPNVSGDGGSSDGLFQMEYSNWDRRFRGRECFPRIPINSRGLDFQFNCTASIMRDINCRRSAVLGNGNGNTIFWSQLQRTNGDISNMIKRFPGCL